MVMSCSALGHHTLKRHAGRQSGGPGEGAALLLSPTAQREAAVNERGAPLLIFARARRVDHEQPAGVRRVAVGVAQHQHHLRQHVLVQHGLHEKRTGRAGLCNVYYYYYYYYLFQIYT